MRLRIELDGTPIQAVLESIQIQKEWSGRNSSASFTVAVSGAVPDPAQQQEVIIYNDANDDKVFRGFVTAVSIDQKNGTLQIHKVTCTGIEWLLDQYVVNTTYTSQTDRQIIQAAFGGVLPEITTANATVAALSGAITFEAKDLTLRELLENLANIVGAEWRVQEDKALSWRAAGSVHARLGFSDVPIFV